MPRPSEAEYTSLAANVAKISTATRPAGVFSGAIAPDGSRDRLSTAEIFLIRCVVLDQHAAVDGQRHTGDHARRVTREKQDRIGYVVGLAHATEWDLQRPCGLRLLGRHCATKARRGRARANGVDADTIGGELVSGVARQPEETGLRRRIIR